MSEEWSKLDTDGKAKFDKLCSLDKERYNTEMIGYKEKLKKDEAKIKRAEKKAEKDKAAGKPVVASKKSDKVSKGTLLGKNGKPTKSPKKGEKV